MIDPLLSRVIAVAFALLWLLAAWHKLSARAAFRATLEEYRLLPAVLLPLATWLIPASEALLGSDDGLLIFQSLLHWLETRRQPIAA